MSLRASDTVQTAPLVALGLLGGYVTARESGIRPLGGVLLAGAGLLAGRTWLAKGGPALAGGLAGLYLLGFGLSHPLARKIGAWPSVAVVTAANVTANHLLVDRDLTAGISRCDKTVAG
jgi:hypothetical protein